MRSVACLCVCVGVCASESFLFLRHGFLQSRSLKTELVIKKNPTDSEYLASHQLKSHSLNKLPRNEPLRLLPV